MSTRSPRNSPTGSPCVGRCTATSLGDEICRGCGRTAEEVRDWNTYDSEQKMRVKELAHGRLHHGKADY